MSKWMRIVFATLVLIGLGGIAAVSVHEPVAEAGSCYDCAENWGACTGNCFDMGGYPQCYAVCNRVYTLCERNCTDPELP